ncbi:MAG: aminotransferase class III-fold pyridoxal phosphate-dependent enzyme, partial [Cytophagaceae bacterium]
MLPDTLSVAAVNSHSLCVVAGSDEDIAAFAQLLDQKSIPNRVLETSHAFHSAMMDPVVTPFAEVVQQVTLSRPQKPIVSTVTGTWLTDKQATDPAYWAAHLRQTVQFADALDTIFALRNPLLLEVGPGTSSTLLARQQAGTRPMTAVASLHRRGEQTDYQALLTALGTVWLRGLEPNWTAFYTNQTRKRVQLPTYAFDRKRCWVNPPVGALPLIPTQGSQAMTLHKEEVTGVSGEQQDLAQNPDYQSTYPSENTIHSTPPIPMRSEHLLTQINTLLEDASGIDLAGTLPTTSFLEIGLDSLLLTQVSISLRRTFGVPITFRQLSGEFDTPQKLATYLDAQLPAEAHQPAAAVAAPVTTLAQPSYAQQAVSYPSVASQPGGDSALGLIAQQLQILAKQVALMQGSAVGTVPVQAAPQPVASPPVSPPNVPVAHAAPKMSVSLPTTDITPEEAIELKKPFGATARIDRQVTGLSDTQQTFLAELTTRYNQKTAKSKAYTQQHRAQMADPRVVSGFRPLTKEIVYPLVINKSKGSRLWDLDGNEYIDALNGFGATMFGHQPDFIKEALHEQVENGYEVGPQHELAGEVCQLVCEFTKFDRAALCSTGSEAVLGTMRVARTVTGRSLIVAFTGSYHGIVDEVLVRGTKKLKTFPAAAGIMPEAVQNMLILDYGTDE